MATYGPIYTKEQAKKQLLESNRDYNNRLTWQNLFLQNNAAAAKAESQLVQQYDTATADAYVSYLQNQNALANSSIVGAGRERAYSENELALQDAYNTYRQQLSEGATSIEESRQEQEQNITALLEKQAEMTSDYTNAHIDYLNELWNKYQAGENQLFAEGTQWNKYVRYNPLLDEAGNPILDEEGNPVLDMDSSRLMNTDELNSMLYDSEGNLTIKGVDFFDQLENQLANEGGYSWSDYLQETNPELYEWATTYNPYNYTENMTNAGTMRTMYGLGSNDQTYQFAERYAGVSEKELDTMFNNFAESLGEVNINTASDISNKIMEMANEFGIDEDLKAAGIDIEKLNDLTEQLVTDYEKQVAESTNKAGLGVVAGAATGAAIGSFLPGIGTAIGGLIGTLIGAAGGIGGKALSDAQVKAKYNEQLQQAYNNLITEMTNYVRSKRRESEINFNI